MTNFEYIIKNITLEAFADNILSYVNLVYSIKSTTGMTCPFCIYSNLECCSNECTKGVRAWLRKEHKNDQL